MPPDTASDTIMRFVCVVGRRRGQVREVPSPLGSLTRHVRTEEARIMRTDIPRLSRDAGFRHDALFYAGADGFVTRTSAFIRDSLADGEPILVVVSEEKIDLLRRELGGERDGVRFADMQQIGRNPARIIPAWREFAAEYATSRRRFRGIGEPIWATRSASELVECARHEALLNLAFAGGQAWWLACPYDTESLPEAVLAEAERNHPWVTRNGERERSRIYRGLDDVARPFDDPLPEPDGGVQEHRFTDDSLAMLRLQVAAAAAQHGLDPARTGDMVLIVNEVATNSVRYGGGSGILRMWEDAASVICEVRDRGRIVDPLVGRTKPPADRGSGFGLWLANEICDLVQIRTFPTGSVVRLHFGR
jgi:anti-sigma regulatory factor (Ser/Thr protein kinase)